jgi:hypothetical protein
VEENWKHLHLMEENDKTTIRIHGETAIKLHRTLRCSAREPFCRGIATSRGFSTSIGRGELIEN